MAPKKKAAGKVVSKPPVAHAPGEHKAVNDTDDPRVLPKKESELFRLSLQHYEQKQYKTGLKTVQQILDVYPEHGESLAMKGIFLTCTGSKPEGYETVKRGVARDPSSHIVWHVYALVLRADKNYEEAAKCYKKATQLEPDSLSLVNDLAMLSVHLRHYEDYADARLSILRSQPRVRRNWVYLAVAQHLAGQLWQADRTLTVFEDMLRDVPDREYEYSEILLYHASIMEEMGDLERTLDFLSEHTGQIVDRTAYSAQRAHILLKLGRMEAADWAWEVLLEENPDSYEYIKASVLAKGGDCGAQDEEGRKKAIQILDTLAEKHPRSLAVRRITLELVQGDEFRTRATKYLTDALSKGVPSIFADIKALYSDKGKRDIIGELAEAFKRSLEESSTFGQTGSQETIESSTVYLWTLYFLAQHYSSLGRHSDALSTIALAIAHTPSLPDIWMLRARVLKRAGDDVGAMESMNEARLLDGQDRFLNSKAAKYMIRAGELEEAEKVLGLFTKKDAPSPLEDLLDMQCLWVVLEEAEAFRRQDKNAMALKRYHQLFKLFTDIEEDQYDFHGYCVRKGTLRAYIKMVRYMDTLRSHPRFIAAAQSAVQLYLALHDDPSSVRPALSAEESAAEDKRVDDEVAAKRAEEEKRIAEQRVKEKEEREKEEKEKKKLAGKDKGKKPTEKQPEREEPYEEIVVDEDPYGTKLLKTDKPLEEASKIVMLLQREASQNVLTWVLSYQIAIRQAKHLQALRAIRTAQSLNSAWPLLRPAVAHFAATVQSPSFDSTETDEQVRSTIQTALPSLLEDQPLEQYLTAGLQARGTDGDQVLAAARATLWARYPTTSRKPDAPVPEVEDLLSSLLRDEIDVRLSHLVEARELLSRMGSQRLPEFEQGARTRFPLARVFMSEQEREAMDAKRKMEHEAMATSDKEIVEQE